MKAIKQILFITCITLPTFSLELKDFAIEYKKSIGTNRHWALPEKEVKQGELNILFKQRYEMLYLNGAVKTFFTDRQFRYGALEGEFGVSYKNIDMFLHHESEHALDRYHGKKYPNSNSIGIRLNLK